MPTSDQIETLAEETAARSQMPITWKIIPTTISTMMPRMTKRIPTALSIMNPLLL